MKLDGERVRERRERLALSMENASSKARVSPHTWVRAEHGGKIRPSSARRIAEALGVEPEQLMEPTPSGKAQAPPPPEAPEDPAVYEERRAKEFMSLFPSEDQRIAVIERRTEVCRYYVGRWVSERQDIEKNGTFTYGKSKEMQLLRDGLLEALNNEGTAHYANWVIVENVEVPSRERVACVSLDDAMAEMYAEVDQMRKVEQENRQGADEALLTGIKALEELIQQPRG